LSSLLRRIGRLPIDKALQVAQHICAGLGAAHAKGILHLDLKPANVMIDGRGVARITDFGLAAAPGDPPELAGTPAYMAPEQLAGHPPTVATDVFALGLVLYETVTGRQLFAGSTLQDRQNPVTVSEPPPPSTYAPGLDVAADAVIIQCLAANPAERPPSALAVATALPGGDVLRAAIAAGHIPSPEVVATYASRPVWQPAVIWALLTTAIAGLLLAAQSSGTMMLFRRVAMDKSPAVLADRGAELLSTIPDVATARDRAYWFTSLYSYAEQVQDLRATPNETARPSAPSQLLFVMRESPRALTPENLFGVVKYRDPGFDVEGMADVTLDTHGSLIRFAVVPQSTVGSEGQPGIEWKALFSAAGLAIERFSDAHVSEPVPVPADVIRGWIGPDSSGDATRLRIVAATFRGRPVYFDVQREPFESPLVKPDRTAPLIPGLSAVLVLLYVAWAGAAILARRNLRRGQGDRPGARRLVAYFAAMMMGMGLLRADHLADFPNEYWVLLRTAVWAVFWSASVYVLYIGFEPLARRRWPRILASWTSVLSGRWRDAQVGGDVLAGVAAGIAAMLWMELQFVISNDLFSVPLRPLNPTLEAFRDARHVLALACYVQAQAISASLVALFLVVLFRETFRRQWIANIVWVLFTAPVLLVAGDNLPMELIFAAVFSAFGLYVFMRVGFLSFLVMLTVYYVLTHFPITLDWSAWYMDRALFALALVAALAVYGWYTALWPRQQPSVA
jgi:serine/threonine-protein kinase